MNKSTLLLLGLPLAGCLSSRVSPTTEDPAFMLVQDAGQPRVSSAGSAIETPIVGQERLGDTLLLTYKKKAPLFFRANMQGRSIVPLDDQTKYVQCANRLFQVVKTGQGFALEPVQ